MRGRSHRHRVPTARPPAGALGVVYIWGRGPIGPALQAYLRRSKVAIAERDDIARALALEHGCPIDLVPDAWAWRMDGAEAKLLDELTRGDSAVMGWTQYQRERCEPSVALLNALNALSPDELTSAAPQLRARFCAPAPEHTASRPGQWIACDDRIAYFDPGSARWRLE